MRMSRTQGRPCRLPSPAHLSADLSRSQAFHRPRSLACATCTRCPLLQQALADQSAASTAGMQAHRAAGLTRGCISSALKGPVVTPLAAVLALPACSLRHTSRARFSCTSCCMSQGAAPSTRPAPPWKSSRPTKPNSGAWHSAHGSSAAARGWHGGTGARLCCCLPLAGGQTDPAPGLWQAPPRAVPQAERLRKLRG